MSDLFLMQFPSGGDLEVTGGVPRMTQGFDTAVYISLFGDSSKQWWGNAYLRPAQRLEGNFLQYIRNNPITLSGVNSVKKFIEKDLDWLIQENAVQKIDVTVSVGTAHLLEVVVELWTNWEQIVYNKFQLNWKNQTGVVF